MPVSRRKLLQHSMLAIAACAAGPKFGWASDPKNSSSSSQQSIDNTGLQHLDRKQFTNAVGSAFSVTSGSVKSSPVWLRLLAVHDLPALVPVNPASMAVPPKHQSSHTQTSGFMLSFLGTLPKPLPQGTYTFEHSAMGKFSLLIVPDGGSSQTYTAVVNRL